MQAAMAQSGPVRRDKAHYSFDDDRLQDIGRENIVLLNKLAGIATRRPGQVVSKPAVTKIESSYERNRRKQAAEIEKQNLMLLKKLQGTKGTVSKLQARQVPKPGGGLSVRPVAWAGAGAGYDDGYRPAWMDANTTSRPADPANGYYGHGSSMNMGQTGGSGGSGGSGSPGSGKMFRGARDLSDIALSACPDKHTLR